MKRTVWLCAAVCGIWFLASAHADEIQVIGLDQTCALSQTQLRGYGRLSATRWLGDERGSILRISCEDEQRSGLLLAKYESDIQALPGSERRKLDIGAKQVIAWHIPGDGMVCAWQTGAAVWILAAGDESGLGGIISERLQGDLSGCKFQSSVQVPMWLDRWDKYGLRFYYRPWEQPGGESFKDYDITGEFAYADRMQKAGFLFWNQMMPADTAEGLMNYGWWDWALRESAARKLPVGIQSMYSPLTWLSNRYREQTMQKMPQFCGDRYGVATDFDGGQGFPSWCGDEIREQQMSLVQESMRYLLDKYDNITSWLEPNGELEHRRIFMMLEYGPVADHSFRTYLKQQYPDISTLAQRWTGDAKGIASWDEVRGPELAAFAGWKPGALDLSGEWRVCYYDAPEVQVYQPEFNDRSWPKIIAPGSDRTLLLREKKTAVYRRTFEIPAEWSSGRGVWLYVWDLNTKTGSKVLAHINGKQVGESTIRHNEPHWGAYEVTSALRDGNNLLALTLPEGFLAYRIYLSDQPPAQYPHLGRELNARWVDFCDWTAWSRLRSVERSVQMMRQNDPDRGIMFMAPDDYADGIKSLCERFGGEFHNTGYMGVFWADKLPMLMRSSRLPFSVEPGAPARDLDEFKKMMGLYAIEGIQGLDYYIHIGSVMWDEAIRKHFEENQQRIRLIGKYHSPQAQVALLLTSRNTLLTGFPWSNNPNANLVNGYWNWNVGNYIIPEYERDAIAPADLANGTANAYRVILDTNNSIMDEELVRRIEEYVRAGGIFVTYVQTGRHTPVDNDSWPISRLTGYKTISIDRAQSDGSFDTPRKLVALPGQTVFPEERWRNAPPANGLSLVRDRSDCVDLLRWEDGSVAAGLRPLGKGYIIQLGAKFAHDRIWYGNPEWTRRMFLELLAWSKVPKVPAALRGVDTPPFASDTPGSYPPSERHARPVMLRHYLSNNGFFDIWMLWNSTKETVQTGLDFGPEVNASVVLDGNTGLNVSLDEVRNLRLTGLETRCFLTPRKALVDAPLAWLRLQCDWWRATETPTQAPIPAFQPKHAVDLSGGWHYKPLGDLEEGTDLLTAAADISGWQMRDLGIWNLPDQREVRRAVLRREFVVPQHWQAGKVLLWLKSWHRSTFMDKGRVYLDGKPLGEAGAEGVNGVDITALCTPGSKHLLAVEIAGKGTLNGCRGSSWLSFLPAPRASLDLTGEWIASDDVLRYERKLYLPGEWKAYTALRKVPVPADWQGTEVAVRVEFTGAGPIGVLINGKWLRRHHHLFGNRLDLVVTPWIRFGEDNEIEIVGKDGPVNFRVTAIALDAYAAGMGP